MRRQEVESEVQKRGEGLLDAFNNPVSPRSYLYDRMRFLIESRGNWHKFLLRSLGYRLMTRNPNDYDVMYFFIGLLQQGNRKEIRVLAISYAQKYVRKYPERPNSYILLSNTYYYRWLPKEGKHDPETAIMYLRKYLSMLSPGNPNREMAIKSIKRIENSELFFKKKYPSVY